MPDVSRGGIIAAVAGSRLGKHFATGVVRRPYPSRAAPERIDQRATQTDYPADYRTALPPCARAACIEN